MGQGVERNKMKHINKIMASGICLFITWLFILAGAVEAVWGLQSMCLTASNHSLYALTGSFYNPGPYSGFLAMTLPVCLYEWLKRRKEKKTTAYYVALSVLLLLICVLPAGMSRSAWMAGRSRRHTSHICITGRRFTPTSVVTRDGRKREQFC